MLQYANTDADKIVLIKKYNSSNFFWQNLVRKKKIIQLSVEEVVNKYEGFEGELIFSFSTNKEFSNAEKKIIQEHKNISDKNNYLTLYITSNIDIPFNLKNYFFQIGYDYGICEEDKTIYSSIFNEILFGSIEDLIFYREQLNEHLLFSNKFLAKKYAQLHHQLLIEGKDVENEQMQIYEIWKYKD